MVVTLEPCNHTGRTGPCTEAVIAAGIERVVVAAIDPDHQVGGSGLERLRTAGVQVDLVDPASELGHRAHNLDPGYFHHRRTGRAQTVVKIASTLDGQTAALDGTSQWITGPEIRQKVHWWRSTCDAVMVGAGTLRKDDPTLTVRTDEFSGPQPRPVVIAGTRQLPADAVIWNRDPIVIAPQSLEIPAGDLIVAGTGTGLVDLEAALRALPALGVLRVFIEAGARLAGSLLRAGLIDVGITHIGGRLAGGTGSGVFAGEFGTIDDARDVILEDVMQVGNDIEVVWSIRPNS